MNSLLVLFYRIYLKVLRFGFKFKVDFVLIKDEVG